MGTRWLESCVVLNVFMGCEHHEIEVLASLIQGRLSLLKPISVSVASLYRHKPSPVIRASSRIRWTNPRTSIPGTPDDALGASARSVACLRPIMKKSGMKKGFSSSAEMRNRAHLYLFPGALQNREHGAPPSRGVIPSPLSAGVRYAVDKGGWNRGVNV